MGGKSSSQTVGYKYLASVVRMIGFRIENLIGVNFDNRGWIFKDEEQQNLIVDKPTLFGEAEGGVQGVIEVHQGLPSQPVSAHYAQYDPLASSMPYQSYLVLRGVGGGGFYHGNSNTMKECLLMPKRIHVQNDGSQQWYDEKSEIPDNFIADIDDDDNYGIQPVGISGTIFGGTGYSATVWGIPIWHPMTVGSFPYDSGRNSALEVHVATSDKPRIVYFWADFGGETLEFIEEAERFDSTKNPDIVLQKSVVACALIVPPNQTKIGTILASVDADYAYQQAQLRIWISTEPFEGFEWESSGDINPIHKIREILTNPYPWGMGKPEIDVNDANFRKAASRIYDEGLGVSWAVKDKDCLEAINELCYHIEAGCRVNRQTGQYEIVLLRDDWFTEEEIHTIAANKIKSINIETTSIEDLVNQVDVKFYNRDEIKDGAFSIADVGLNKTMGYTSSEDIELPYFMNMRNAEIVAQWKLAQLSTATWRGTFSTGLREARHWNRYDLLYLDWPKRFASPILVRIMRIDLGTPTDNTVEIDFIEVASSIVSTTQVIIADESQANVVLPPMPNRHILFEMPYYLLVMNAGQREVDGELEYESDYGIVGVLASKPQNNAIHAALYNENDERIGTTNFKFVTSLTNDIDRLESTIELESTANITAGMLCLVGSEWLEVESISLNSITVKRGALDTIPTAHLAAAEIWFTDAAVGYATTEYVAPEIAEIKVLTTTPSGIEQGGTLSSVELDSRAIRPYPPANVKFDDVHWKQEFTGDLVITWSHRNRTQQTTPELILGWYDTSVTLEEGVQYVLEYDELNNVDVVLNTVVENLGAVDTHTILVADLDVDAAKLAIQLYTVRDGYESMQKVEHTIELSDAFNAPYNLVGTYENDEVTLTWDFDE